MNACMPTWHLAPKTCNLSSVNGILLIDKPTGWTSHDVVAKVRATLRQELSRENRELRISSNSQFPIPNSLGPKVRVGHTGTLDPMATGLLVLVIGNYTKRAAEFSKLDKVYEAEITLGATSTTGDREGEIIVDGRQKTVDREEIEAVLQSFIGEIEQIPPAFSAIKVDGKRAYKLARAGQKVKMEPRKVTVYGLQPTYYKYPILKIKASVSSGTYIRSLAIDIGEALSTGAYLSALRRTQVGNFDLKNALQIQDLPLLTTEV